MLKSISIKDLYALALAEGEGMGTAYEYFAKRLVLGPWLRGFTRPKRVLVAGLPEKYGSSLDSLLLANELGAQQVTVIDDRPGALDKLASAMNALREDTPAVVAVPELVTIDAWDTLPGDRGRFDMAISSELLQRLPAAIRPAYVSQLRALADHVALFAPNAENPAHTDRSGLGGLTLAELRALADAPGDIRAPARTGYVDMPPFPPGITRSDDQREQASTGLFEASVMRGLESYARSERFLPQNIRRRQSHIVYALMPG